MTLSLNNLEKQLDIFVKNDKMKIISYLKEHDETITSFSVLSWFNQR